MSIVHLDNIKLSAAIRKFVVIFTVLFNCIQYSEAFGSNDMTTKSKSLKMHRSTFLNRLLVSWIGTCTAFSPYSINSISNNNVASAFAFFGDGNSNGEKLQKEKSSYNTSTSTENNSVISSTYTNGSSLPTTPIKPKVVYKALLVDIPSFDVKVPVAMWFPANQDQQSTSSSSSQQMDPTTSSKRLIMEYPSIQNRNDLVSPTKSSLKATYSHRISVKKIGTLLAGMEFIPDFVSQNFNLQPTSTTADVVSDGSISWPSNAPVVFLAHGYLGSRFDLAHLAEELARQGFVCFSPEYPESLASSYPSREGLDRSQITKFLLQGIQSDMAIKPTSYGIVGHSLGCGTVMTTGDDSWTRVCIAGPPARRDGVKVNGNTLAIISVNDGAVTMGRITNMIPSDFYRLQEKEINKAGVPLSIPKKAVLIIDREDAPNHISFLAGNVNDAMVNFLSPLLPVAQALKIPVLDFDKYKESRDSEATAKVVLPLICSYLKTYML